MTIFYRIWNDDFVSELIPGNIEAGTKFRKDGWPDKRCKKRNTPFWEWVKSMHILRGYGAAYK